MIQRCEEFYTKLYSTRQARQSSVPALPATYEPPPPILPSEVRVAIKRLKRGKAPGEDNITTAVLQDGGEPIIKALTQLFNRCLSDGRVPSSWKNASVVLIHKKGDTADIKKLPTHQPSTSDLQGVLTYPPPADATGTRTTSAARTGWLQARILHHWPHSCC